MYKSIYSILILAASTLLLMACSSHKQLEAPTPENALERLKEGNQRFSRHHMKHPDQSEQRLKETAAGQKPFAVVITCADSRVAPEIIFDEGIGDLFTIRNAGNVVDQNDVLASVEYAIEHLGVHTVVVMGHEQCGAIKAMVADDSEAVPEHIAAILALLRTEPEEQTAIHSDKTGETLVHDCVIANVEHGVKSIKTLLEKLPHHEHISVEGAVYDIRNGQVHFLSETRIHQ